MRALGLENLKVGNAVVFVDPYGNPRDAIVTAIHGSTKDGSTPCINVVVTTSDPSMTDQYGRQITRMTSVVYRTSQPAHGNYYTMPGEPLNAVAERKA